MALGGAPVERLSSVGSEGSPCEPIGREAPGPRVEHSGSVRSSYLSPGSMREGGFSDLSSPRPDGNQWRSSLLSSCGSLVLQFLRLSVQTSQLISLRSGGTSSTLELVGVGHFRFSVLGRLQLDKQSGSRAENCRAAFLSFSQGDRVVR